MRVTNPVWEFPSTLSHNRTTPSSHHLTVSCGKVDKSWHRLCAEYGRHTLLWTRSKQNQEVGIEKEQKHT